MIRRFAGQAPQIHPSCFVEESAQVIGDVHLGERSSVWFNAVIRGDVHAIRIGRETNVQDLCCLHVFKGKHPLHLGDRVTVGHGVTLHGCVVRDRCLIGMGAILLDACEIGEGSLIGAGALVPPGMKVAPGSLVLGSPGRVKRPLTAEERALIETSADNYLGYAQAYLAERR